MKILDNINPAMITEPIHRLYWETVKRALKELNSKVAFSIDTGNSPSSTGGGVTRHGALTGLDVDDHKQYLLLAGRTGGQTVSGVSGAATTLTLHNVAGQTGKYLSFTNSGGTEIAYMGLDGRFNTIALGINADILTATPCVQFKFGATLTSSVTNVGAFVLFTPNSSGPPLSLEGVSDYQHIGFGTNATYPDLSIRVGAGTKELLYHFDRATTGISTLTFLSQNAGTNALPINFNAARVLVNASQTSVPFNVVKNASSSLDLTRWFASDGTTVLASVSSAGVISGSGASLTSIPESAIVDGAILARVAADETITGNWYFNPTATPDVCVKIRAPVAGVGTGVFQVIDDAGSTILGVGMIGSAAAVICPGIAAQQYAITDGVDVNYLEGAGWSNYGTSFRLPDPGVSGADIVCTQTVQTLNNKTLSQTGNTLRSNSASGGVAFEDNGTTTKKLRMVLSGAVGNNTLTIANTAAKDYKFPNLGGIVAITGTPVDLTGQTAAITTTNIITTIPAGVYNIQVVAACTTASGSGTPNLDVTIGWTDVVGATTQKAVTALSLSATGRASGSVIAQVASGTLTYATTINSASGSPQYALYIRATLL